MLLLWHEALGCDDEQAADDELCARVLYAQGEDGAPLAGERMLQALHLTQGLLAFGRALKSGTAEAPSGWTPQWASVTLSRRRFFVLETEPRVFMALGVQPAMEMKNHRSAFQALVQDVYSMFRLLHGSIESNLRLLPSVGSETGGASDLPPLSDQSIPQRIQQYTDGMELLADIGVIRKRLRKLRLAIDSQSHEHSANDQSGDEDAGQGEKVDGNSLKRLQKQKLKIEAELELLLSCSPAAALRRKCANFFPALLNAMDVCGASGFSELQGLGYFPMDQPTFLALQSFVNGFHSELRFADTNSGADPAESSALFFKGNLLWSSMETRTMRLLSKFLRLREERGMTVSHGGNNVENDAAPLDEHQVESMDSTLWMEDAYDDTFLPIWSSKISYAECEAVTQSQHGPHLRLMARSLHKQHPVSLSTFLSDPPPLSMGDGILSPSSSAASSPFGSPSHSTTSTRLGPPKSTGVGGGHAYSKNKNAIKTRTSSISFRNAGLLMKNGRFAKLLQTNTRPSVSFETNAVLSPRIYPLEDADAAQSARHRALVWHEEDLTMIIVLQVNGTNSTSGSDDLKPVTVERLEDYLDGQQRFQSLAQLISTRYYTTFAPEKNVPNLHPLPPFVYLNRVNLAFRMQHVPRLLKSKEEDLFPVPVRLLAHYFPASTMALVNELHAELQSSSRAGNREICVRTRHSGWILAKKSETSRRELYVFFDSKISSVHDLSESLQTLLRDQFGNVLF